MSTSSSEKASPIIEEEIKEAPLQKKTKNEAIKKKLGINVEDGDEVEERKQFKYKLAINHEERMSERNSIASDNSKS